jgi:hypothetical protein
MGPTHGSTIVSTSAWKLTARTVAKALTFASGKRRDKRRHRED